MTELIKINLLPYREEIKQRKRQQFKILMLSSLLIGVGLSAIAYLAINNAIKGALKASMAAIASPPKGIEDRKSVV